MLKATSVTDDSAKRRRLLDTQIERWTSEAKKLMEAGQETNALELYRQAADELPGAPWLQHRTAELARKLKKGDVAIIYFRRAATAFQMADFGKRAVAPLRTAWTLAAQGLPATSKTLVELALELVQLHRRLGFAADATVTLERTNTTLRNRGFSEISEFSLEALERESSGQRLIPANTPPRSEPPSPDAPETSSGLRSEAVPAARSAGHTGDASADSRSRALARLLARR